MVGPLHLLIHELRETWEARGVIVLVLRSYPYLRARAAMAGMTQSDFLLAEIRKVAEKPTPEEMLLGTEAGQRIAPRVLSVQETLHAPHLLDAEVAQVVRRYWPAGSLKKPLPSRRRCWQSRPRSSSSSERRTLHP
jgi:hypothetical protein